MLLRHKVTIGIIVALSLAAVAAWPHVSSRIRFYQLTGHFFPVRMVEKLHKPVAVTGWSDTGLHLADGRTLQLPGFRKLPAVSVALTEATKRGVEIAANGRVYGLVRVDHWCGNDAVREHIARVDVADVLNFV